MHRFYLNPKYAAQLANAQLDDFSRLPVLQASGELIERDTGRTTHRVILGGAAYYLKCVTKATPGSALEALFTLRAPHHYCWREMLQVKSLQDSGIAVMDVAAAGEAIDWGVPRLSFILVREVEGESLHNLFTAGTLEQRQIYVKQLGELHGQLHRSGFFASARMHDIIVNNQGRFVLIDRETRKPLARRFTRSRALSSLDRTLSRQNRHGTHWSEDELRDYLEAYVASTSPNLGITAAELRKHLGDPTAQ